LTFFRFKSTFILQNLPKSTRLWKYDGRRAQNIALKPIFSALNLRRLEELAQHVETSISTVRRDLTALEAGGKFARTHGGARIVNAQNG
jgi:hypothetical protein